MFCIQRSEANFQALFQGTKQLRAHPLFAECQLGIYGLRNGNSPKFSTTIFKCSPHWRGLSQAKVPTKLVYLALTFRLESTYELQETAKIAVKWHDQRKLCLWSDTASPSFRLTVAQLSRITSDARMHPEPDLPVQRRSREMAMQNEWVGKGNSQVIAWM